MQCLNSQKNTECIKTIVGNIMAKVYLKKHKLRSSDHNGVGTPKEVQETDKKDCLAQKYIMKHVVS
jgi:hypothetical protein